VDGVRKYVKGQSHRDTRAVATACQCRRGEVRCSRAPGTQATEVEAWVSTPLPRKRQDPGSGRSPSRALDRAIDRVETSRMSTPFGGSRRFAAAKRSWTEVHVSCENRVEKTGSCLRHVRRRHGVKAPTVLDQTPLVGGDARYSKAVVSPGASGARETSTTRVEGISVNLDERTSHQRGDPLPAA
jgi:hypothetical protein